MATQMVMPLLGQTMEEGTITKWLKNEGDKVEKGEPILEVMTDKANMEVEAPVSGVLRKIIAKEEQIVPIKEVIAIIGTADEPIDDLLVSTPTAPGATAPIAEQIEPVAAPPAAESTAPAVSPRPTTGRIFSSPRARMVASENNVDLAALAGKGTGPGGRIVEQDVLAYVASGAVVTGRQRITPLAGKVAADRGVDLTSVTPTGVSGRITRDDVLRSMTAPRPSIGRVIPMTGMRKAVADNVSRSIRNAPHVTLVMEVDMTECARLRKQIAPEIEKTHGVKISFTDLIVKAVAKAIDNYPLVNATLENDQITVHDDINIGIAVALDNGLIAPVVRDVRSKSIPQISNEVKTLAGKARSGSLKLEEYQGGTFTITNLGAYGVDVFNPVINPPQIVILGVCRIVDKPAVIDGRIQIRSMMNLCLSFDHRAIDGAPAAEYLAHLKEVLESPYTLLI
jgi:pyruvate dehydrogenase E2 component (dihydrolipoamide acetyltransferase)